MHHSPGAVEFPWVLPGDGAVAAAAGGVHSMVEFPWVSPGGTGDSCTTWGAAAGGLLLLSFGLGEATGVVGAAGRFIVSGRPFWGDFCGVPRAA